LIAVSQIFDLYKLSRGLIWITSAYSPGK
jgi:hypothetical protein